MYDPTDTPPTPPIALSADEELERLREAYDRELDTTPGPAASGYDTGWSGL